MKRLLGGYASLVREMLGLHNDASFLSLPASPAVLIAICGVIGLIRNAVSVVLGGDAYGFYSFQPDIQWTMLWFPINLFLFPAALLHWQLRLLGYRNVNADSIFGLAFHLQFVHLIVPFVDWLGYRLGIPASYVLGTHAVATEWYTNILYMSPGIILGWWITAYTVVRVFRRRLGIGWFAVLFTSLTTFVVILIPTYFLFPSLNALFNRTFGPLLWSPLKYLTVTPKWFPFWGNGTYFALTATLGLVYYASRKSEEGIKSLLVINSSARAYAWLLAFAVVRSILDYFWIPIYVYLIYKILSLFNTTVYLFTLYLLIPAIAGFILERVFARPVNQSGVLRESVLVWIVYPAVTVISLMLKSPPMRSIEWFRNIPTFMVETNFLPAGMIAVIPVLIVFYTWQMMRHSGADWLRALAAVLVSLWVVYLVYYQYTMVLFVYFYKQYGLVFGFGYATLVFLIPLFPLARRFHEAFGPHRVMLPRLVLAAALISAGLMAAGLLGWFI